MTTSLVFSEAIRLLYEFEDNPIPEKMFIRHRSQYEYILSVIHLGNFHKTEVSINSLISNTMLGSQPTICRRINELEKFKLIETKKTGDLRIRSLIISEQGEKYLQKCFDIFLYVYKLSE